VIGIVFGIVFVDLLGFGILIPVIPLYAESFGATEFTASLLIAAYSAFQFLFAPVLGRISDVRGRRPVLLVSLSGSVIAWTLFGLAELVPETGILLLGPLGVLFLARILAGAMGGNIATAQAYIADVTRPEDRAKGLGLLGAAFGLGFVFGPALGGVLASGTVLAVARSVLPAAVPVSQFSLPSFGAATITALNLVAAALLLPESRPPEDRPDPDGSTPRTTDRVRERFDSLYEAATAEVLGTLIVAFFVASFAFSALESQFIFFTNDTFGYGTSANGVLLAYLGVVIAVVQGGLIGPLTSRFGEYRLAVAGAGIQVLTLAAVPLSPWLGSAVPAVGPLFDALPVVPPGVIALVVVLTVLSFGNAITNVSLNTLVSRSTSDADQGGAFGLTQSAGSLARTFGPSVAGLFYTVLGAWVPFVVAGLLFVPVAGMLLRVDQELLAGDEGESSDGAGVEPVD